MTTRVIGVVLTEELFSKSDGICRNKHFSKNEQYLCYADYKATKHIDNGLKEIIKSNAIELQKPVTISEVKAKVPGALDNDQDD